MNADLLKNLVRQIEDVGSFRGTSDRIADTGCHDGDFAT